MDGMTERLYGCDVEEVDGNEVSPGTIGLTDLRFARPRITVPKFNRFPASIIRKYRPVINTIRDAIKTYVLGHEIEAEVKRKPRNEDEHAAYELDWLETLRENGRWFPYLVGLVMHKLRLKYGDKTGFSIRIADYVDSRLRIYAKEVEAVEPVIDAALNPELEPAPVYV